MTLAPDWTTCDVGGVVYALHLPCRTAFIVPQEHDCQSASAPPREEGPTVETFVPAAQRAKAALRSLTVGAKAGRADYVGMLSLQDALALHEHIEALTNALADMVVKATDYGSQDGGFVYAYIIPTGPMHRAIPLLDSMGITVRPGYDGRKNATEATND